MDQARTVGGSQRAQDLGRQAQGLSYRQGAGGDEVAQVRALDVLHDQVGDAVEAALVVDRHHARVRQARRSARLPAETGYEVGGVG